VAQVTAITQIVVMVVPVVLAHGYLPVVVMVQIVTGAILVVTVAKVMVVTLMYGVVVDQAMTTVEEKVVHHFLVDLSSQVGTITHMATLVKTIIKHLVLVVQAATQITHVVDMAHPELL
jgi:hypothetical protein